MSVLDVLFTVTLEQINRFIVPVSPNRFFFFMYFCFLFILQDALRNGLVATEVLMWFYIGECIGKGGLIGYDVQPVRSKNSQIVL